MFHHFENESIGKNCLVRSTDFNYRHQQLPEDSKSPILTVLESAIQCSYVSVYSPHHQTRSQTSTLMGVLRLY
jgi:hypothetical protein